MKTAQDKQVLVKDWIERLPETMRLELFEILAHEPFQNTGYTSDLSENGLEAIASRIIAEDHGLLQRLAQ
jgi:hypothetical protein